MGVPFSCPVDDDDAAAVEGGIPAPAPGSGGEPTVLKASLGSGKLLRAEGELLPRTRLSPESPPRHESAAVTLQKVYRSFRTRRRLADCAVLVEQSWWKLLDFALLKRSSVSFFDIEKQESAVSRWSRARTRAAKVGKGLSKDEKAQKLALQHWLEAIDPRHRYGHNLHCYYDCWLRCESKEPFFYWLDVGEGKEINLERCPRSKLLSQCIKYLGPKEREDYEVVIEDGKLAYKNSRQILDTSGEARDAKWIFVLSTSKSLYVGQKKKGTFQHSSFLAGGATSAAGRLVVEDGVLKAIWPHSGHYRPTDENFQEFQSFLRDNSVDLTDVKMSPDEEDEEFWSRLRSIPSDLHAAADKPEGHDTVATQETGRCQAPHQPTTETTAVEELSEHEQTSCDNTGLKPIATIRSQCSSETAEPSSTICDDSAAFSNKDRREEDGSDDDQSAVVPREQILERISSKKGNKSFQLGKQVSFKWTTGAGPRIVCVRDYPSELQARALERVHLSPRSGRAASSRFASPRRSGSPMARGGCCEPFTPPRDAFRTHLQQGLVIS